jgi:hypothetical protein
MLGKAEVVGEERGLKKMVGEGVEKKWESSGT